MLDHEIARGTPRRGDARCRAHRGACSGCAAPRNSETSPRPGFRSTINVALLGETSELDGAIDRDGRRSDAALRTKERERSSSVTGRPTPLPAVPPFDESRHRASREPAATSGTRLRRRASNGESIPARRPAPRRRCSRSARRSGRVRPSASLTAFQPGRQRRRRLVESPSRGKRSSVTRTENGRTPQQRGYL